MWEVRRVDPAVYLIVLRMKEIILVKLRAPCLTETPGWVKCHIRHLVFCSTLYILLPPYELNLANQCGLFIPWISVCTLSMEGILRKTAKTLADQTFISGTVLSQMNYWSYGCQVSGANCFVFLNPEWGVLSVTGERGLLFFLLLWANKVIDVRLFKVLTSQASSLYRF